MVQKVRLTDEQIVASERWKAEVEAAHMRAVDAYNRGEDVPPQPEIPLPYRMPESVEMTDEELAAARCWSTNWEAARKAGRMRAVAANNQGEEVPSPPPDSSQHPSTPPPQIITNVHHTLSSPASSQNHNHSPVQTRTGNKNERGSGSDETQINTANLFSWPWDEERATGLETIFRAFDVTMPSLRDLGFVLTKSDSEFQFTWTGRVDINTASLNDELKGGPGLDFFMTL